MALEDDGVGRADVPDHAVRLREPLDDLLLVRDGHAQSLDPQSGRVVEKLAQVLARHAERHVDLVQLQVGEGGVVD